MGIALNIKPRWRRRLRRLVTLLTASIILKAVWVWSFHLPATELSGDRYRSDVLRRRSYVLQRVYAERLSPDQMPSFLPAQFRGEWAVGSYSMASTALANIAFRYPETRAESIKVLREFIRRMLSLELRQFDTERWGKDAIGDLASDDGHIGYLGHLGWMMIARRMIGGDSEFDPQLTEIVAALSRRLSRRAGRCLETYPGEIYPPDNMVVYATLRLYDRLFRTTHSTPVDEWIHFARAELLDASTGLLPFWLDTNCRAVGVPRGSGAGWNSIYLPFIDEELASEQFLAIKKTFLNDGVLPGIREYPAGREGPGDVDSGPILFGLSPSGTGFAVAGAMYSGDYETAARLLLAAELAGGTLDLQGRRRYLLAPLVGDAILLATRTAVRWDPRYVAHS